MSTCSRVAQQWGTFSRMWYLLDARLQPPGKVAKLCAMHLKGQNKPIYHALNDCGDHVVVINTRHIAFSGNKWDQKVYSSHSGYAGGFKQVIAKDLHKKDPTAIVRLAVYGMLPSNLLRKTQMMRIHLFPDADIPEDIRRNLVQELEQPRVPPRTLRQYSKEDVEAFPRVWTPPKDFLWK
ncbi:large ribosomal subunit protein uL13m [Lampetra fluviatilis]